MMREHPYSIWSLGGLPSRDAGGTPAPPDVESWGATWRAATPDYLVGVAARQTPQGAVAIAALIESQRRLDHSIVAFDQDTRAHAEALKASVEETGRHTSRLVELTQQTSAQTDEIIELTRVMKRLTVIITVLTVAAALFGGIQAAAVLVHWYRWSRGWL